MPYMVSAYSYYLFLRWPFMLLYLQIFPTPSPQSMFLTASFSLWLQTESNTYTVDVLVMVL